MLRFARPRPRAPRAYAQLFTLALCAQLVPWAVHAQSEPPQAVYPAAPGNVVPPPPPPPANAPGRQTQREEERAQKIEAREAERAQREAAYGQRVADKEAARGARAADKANAIAEREAERMRRDQAVADERRERVARREARAAIVGERRGRWEEHRALHRVTFGVAFAPTMLARELSRNDEVALLRQRTVEFGFGYVHDFTPRIGFRAGAAWGVGVTHFDLLLDNGDGNGSRKRAPSYSLSFEAAPTFNARNFGLYGSAGLALRMLFLPEQRARVSADEYDNRDDYVGTVTRSISFKSPTVALAARLGLGYRFGRNHEYDLGFGFDVGPAFRNAGLYTSMFARFSVAFTDFAFD